MAINGSNGQEPLLTILIPTFRNPQFLRHTLRSLLINTEFPYRIVILNNDGAEGARESLDEIVAELTFSEASVRHLGGNKGWMGAINAGVEQVTTPFFCMLNDDVLFIPGQKEFWRKLLLSFHNPKVAAVGPSSNFVMGGQNAFECALPPVFMTKFLIGFCMVCRTDTFGEVGGLDETLPGGDDLDLSIRFRKAGYDLIAERTVYLHHVGSVTGNKVHEGYWNSEYQTDQTNNALIRKHGLRAWVELTGNDFLSLSKTPVVLTMLSGEDVWIKENTPSDGKGLHLGCGNRTVMHGWGLDRSKTGEHGAGGRKFSGAEPDVTANALNVPMLDNSLDWITAFHLFEHLLDPISALKEWGRVLKPTGRLLVICPNQEDDNTMLVDYTHVHAYTPDTLIDLLEVMGFRIEKIERFPVGTFGLVAYSKSVNPLQDWVGPQVEDHAVESI